MEINPQLDHNLKILECQMCNNMYDDRIRVPKILVSCGHTFCSFCIDKLSQNQSKCPECGMKVNQNNLKQDKFVISQPINQALIIMCKQNFFTSSLPKSEFQTKLCSPVQYDKKSTYSNKLSPNNPLKYRQSIEKFHQEVVMDEMFEHFTPKRTTIQQNSQWTCNNHQIKAIEAFCLQCLQPLCIDCILTNHHKQHKIVSLEQALLNQKEKLIESMNFIQELRFQSITDQEELNQKFQMVETLMTKERETVSNTFIEIRKTVSDLEQQYQSRINQQFEIEKSKYKQSLHCLETITQLSDSVEKENRRIEKCENDKHLILKLAHYRNELLKKLEQQMNHKKQIESVFKNMGVDMKKCWLTDSDIEKFIKQLKKKLDVIISKKTSVELVGSFTRDFSRGQTSLGRSRSGSKKFGGGKTATTVMSFFDNNNSSNLNSNKKPIKANQLESLESSFRNNGKRLSNTSKIHNNAQSRLSSYHQSPKNSNNNLRFPKKTINLTGTIEKQQRTNRLQQQQQSKSRSLSQRASSQVKNNTSSSVQRVHIEIKNQKRQSQQKNKQPPKIKELEKPLDENMPLKNNSLINTFHRLKQQVKHNMITSQILDVSQNQLIEQSNEKIGYQTGKTAEDVEDEDDAQINPAYTHNSTLKKRMMDINGRNLQSSFSNNQQMNSPLKTSDKMISPVKPISQMSISPQRKKWFEKNTNHIATMVSIDSNDGYSKNQQNQMPSRGKQLSQYIVKGRTIAQDEMKPSFGDSQSSFSKTLGNFKLQKITTNPHLMQFSLQKHGDTVLNQIQKSLDSSSFFDQKSVNYKILVASTKNNNYQL